MKLQNHIACIIVFGLFGCTTADKYAGEYAQETGTLKVTQNKDNKKEYSFVFESSFGDRTGELNFFTEIMSDGTAKHINKKNEGDCKLDIKFFNDSFKVDQQGSCDAPMNVYFGGDYAKASRKSSDSKKTTISTQPATPVNPTEQKIIFKTNSVEYKIKGTESSEGYCKQKCSEISEDIDGYINQGWKIASSTPRKQAIDKLCTCDGVEYIVSK